jgi:membrane dipeptidase
LRRSPTRFVVHSKFPVVVLSRRTLLKSAALGLSAPFINTGSFRLFAQTPSAAAYSTLTLDLVRRSTVIDMLGLLTLDYRKLLNWEAQPGSFGLADYARLKDSGITIFHPAVGFTDGDVYASSLRDITGLNVFIEAHRDGFLRVDGAGDFARAKQEGKIGILIGQQNSQHFRTVDDVDCWYGLGQRVSQLTYIHNRLGGGSSDTSDSGLTSFGAQVVERMNKLGMAVDISHCGDRTTLEAIETSSKPVLITHSNCRALVPGSHRCKTDEAIRKTAAKGGVIGITMVRYFVRASETATIEDVLDHIDHVVKLCGVEHVGLGSDVDLDGRDTNPHVARRNDLDGMDYAKKVFDLTQGLLRRNYLASDIQLILGGNFERALSEIWA